MDVNSLFSHGGLLVKNPNYRPDSGQPEYIHNTDISKTSSGLASTISYAAGKGLQENIGDEYINTKLRKYGITPTKYNTDYGRVDKILYDAQSAPSKIMNSLVQAIGGELVLGTVKSFGELVDLIGAAASSEKSIYDQSGYTRFFNNAQEALKDRFQIETLDDVALGSGALTNLGWYASNLPSVMSTLTLLIPSKALTSGIPKLGKTLLKSAKLIKAGDKINDTSNLINYSTRTNRILAKLRRDPITRMNTNTYIEIGADAAIQRTLENYQESKQTYDDQIKNTMDYFTKDDNFKTFKENNPQLIEELSKKGIDISSKQEVAREIARQSANKTFAEDYWNIGFDIIQLAALKNIKLFKGIKPTTGQIERMQRLSKQSALSDTKALKDAEKRSFKNWFKDSKGWLGALGSESTEGVEEAINFIAQQEGINYGNTLIGQNTDGKDLSERLSDYVKNPQLWDSFFWGVIGGITFQAAGSGYNRVRTAIEARNIDKEEGKKLKTWKEYFQTGDEQVRNAAIVNRVAKARELNRKLDLINQGRNPYIKDNPIIENKAELPYYKNRIIDDYVESLTIDEINVGNYELLHDYITNPNVKEVLKKEIFKNDPDADKYLDGLVTKMENIYSLYNKELTRLAKNSKYIKGKVPVEYLQNIATTNVQALLTKANIQEAQKTYEKDLESLLEVPENKTPISPNIDFETYSRLQVITEDLGTTVAQLKALRSNKKELESINGRQIEKKLVKKIQGLIKRIDNLEGLALKNKIQGYNKDVTKLWALTTASKFELVDEKIVKQNTNDYIQLLEDITNSSNEALDKHLKEIYGDIESSDYTDILKRDENKFNSLYDVFGQATKEMAKFMESHEALADTYKILEQLNTEENLIDESYVGEDKNDLIDRLKYLDESAKEIASLAEKEAIDRITSLVDKYGDEALLNKIFNGVDIENLTTEDEAVLNDALKILDLTNKTKAYYDKLTSSIFAQRLVNETLKARDELNKQRNETQSSSTNQNLQNGTKNKKQTKSSQANTKSNTGQKNGKISETSTNNKRKIKLKMSQDGLTFEDTDDNTNDVFTAIKDEKTGNYELVPKSKRIKDGNNITLIADVDEALIQNDELYNDLEKNNHKEGEVATVTSNPIINIDDDNNMKIVKKGTISYSLPFTGESIPANDGKQTQPAKFDGSTDDDYVGGYRGEKYDNLNAEVRDKIGAIWRKAIKEQNVKDVEEFFNNIKTSILNEYSNLDDEAKAALEKGVDKEITSLRRLEARQHKLSKNIKNVLASSISESFDGNNDKLLDAIDELLKTYIKENLGNRRFERNGQAVYFINAEGLYRTIYNTYESKFLVDAIYKLVNDYLATKQNSKYIVTDVNINDPHLLEKVYNETTRSLLKEEQDADNLQKIFIEDKISDEDKKKRNSILETIKKGDKLTVQVEDRDVDGIKYKTLAIKKDGITIGVMALPEAGETGGFAKVNNKWKYDLVSDGTIVEGEIVDAFNNLFLGDEERAKKLIDYISTWTYDTEMSEDDRVKLEKEINKLILESGVSKDLMFGENKEEAKQLKEDENPLRERINHLSKLVKYLTASDKLQYDEIKDFIQNSLNNWFTTLYNSYLTADNLRKNADDYNITIDSFYAGKLVQPKDKKDRVQSFTYKNGEGKTISKGIADKQNAKLSVIYYDRVAGKKYRISDDGTKEEISSGAKPGFISVSIYDRMGHEFPLYANSVRFNDRSIDKNSDASKIKQAISNELTKRLSKLSALANKELESFDDKNNEEVQKAYNELKEFVQKLFYNSYRNPIKLESYDNVVNTPFLAGVFFGIRSESKDFYFTQDKERDDKTKIGLSFGNDHFEILENGEWVSYDYADNTLKLLQTANDILNSTMFNIDYGKINPNTIDNSGFLKINQSGVQIVIPSIDGNDFSISYTTKEMKGQNPYTYAILNGGFLKVNTDIDEKTKTNFTLNNEDMMAQQSLKINVESKNKEEVNKSTPVKGNRDIKEIKVNDEATPIITATDGRNKVEELVKLSGYADNLEALRQFKLLPTNIAIGVQAKDHIRYAYFDGNNKFYVTQDWINLFNSQDKGDREEAIRKLIHEQFHYIFSLNKNKENINKIQKIYDLFKDYVNDHKDDKNYKVGKRYLDTFIKVAEKNNQDALEEFIVESLTSYAFYDYLNNAIIEDKTAIRKKDSIFSKILEFLKELFGWKINRNSIFAKEIGLLHKFDINLDNIQKFEPVGDEIKEETKLTEELDVTYVDMDDDFSEMESSISENYISEMQSIKDKAIADGTFMKAPNGKPTNLTERQWLQVRTKAFKDWFGDWETLTKIKNATVIWGHPGTGKTWLYNQGRKDIIDFDSEYKSKLGNLQEREELKKRIGKDAYNAKLDKLFDEAKEVAIASGRKLLVSDMYFLKNRSEDMDVVTNISDAEFIERSHQRGEHDEADKMEWKNSINKAMQNVLVEKRIDHTGYISDLLDGTNVSKVVDENGEPLVVYHGTNIENISIFDRTQIPEEQTLVGTGTATFGNFFSDKQDDAKSFADITKLRRNSGKATVYNTFLNIKNPMYFETLGDFRDYSHKEGHYNQNGDFVSDVKLPKEYDGVIVKRRNSRDVAKEFVAPNSNQIKSATDNNGEFSLESDNILESAISEKEYPSFNDFMKTVDDEHKSLMINKKDSGDLSIICKL